MTQGSEQSLEDQVAQIHHDLWESAQGKAPRITKYKASQRVLAHIKSDREAALKPLERILDKYGTSKCDECHEYLHDDDMAWCESCPRAFHESCAGYLYDGEGEHPAESAYALCTRCNEPRLAQLSKENQL